jgi:hypothetical protein
MSVPVLPSLQDEQEDEVCSICLEPLRQEAFVTLCGHMFHNQCWRRFHESRRHTHHLDENSPECEVPLRCPLCNRQLAVVRVDNRATSEDDLEAQHAASRRTLVNVTVMLDSHGHIAPTWVEGITVFNCMGTLVLAAHLICAFLGSGD